MRGELLLLGPLRSTHTLPCPAPRTLLPAKRHCLTKRGLYRGTAAAHGHSSQQEFQALRAASPRAHRVAAGGRRGLTGLRRERAAELAGRGGVRGRCLLAHAAGYLRVCRRASDADAVQRFLINTCEVWQCSPLVRRRMLADLSARLAAAEPASESRPMHELKSLTLQSACAHMAAHAQLWAAGLSSMHKATVSAPSARLPQMMQFSC